MGTERHFLFFDSPFLTDSGGKEQDDEGLYCLPIIALTEKKLFLSGQKTVIGPEPFTFESSFCVVDYGEAKK